MTDGSMTPTESRPEVFATLNDVEIILAPHLAPNIRRLIRSGLYEKPEIEIGLANLQPGDRVMEMGTGAGIVGSVFLKQIENLTLQSYEANPDLIPHIRNLYAHNGVDDAATVSNHLVVAGTGAPESLDFEVRDNFLGSRISNSGTDAKARTVPVPTKHYDEITREYPHNVLVMDIEGAELNFLADADLTNVELVMLELHPKAYGVKGRTQVMAHLTKKGFAIDDTTSVGDVVSFKKPDRMKIKPDYTKIGSGQEPQFVYEIDPNEPLVDRIVTVDKAVLARTPRSEGWRITASVFDENRYIVPEAVCWISPRLTATVPRTYPRPNRIVDLPGTWLFGGRFTPAFGHFLSETMSRLWALDHIDEPIEGVLFFPSYNNDEGSAEKLFSQLAEIMDPPVKYKIVDAFYRVDKLIVPPQGSGIGRLLMSSPEMRDYILKHIKRDLKPTGHDKIYISRSGQFGKIGRGFLGEKKLEMLLEDEGYLIFHPQDHSWEDQMRHYLSASHILGPDGSPFHMVNFTGRTDMKVGVIQRRPTRDTNQMVQQGEAFGLKNAHALNHVGRSWSSAGIRRAGLTIVSEVAFSDLCKALKKVGFISKKAKWKDLTKSQIEKELLEIAKEAEADQRPVDGVNMSLSDYPECVTEGKPQVFFDD